MEINNLVLKNRVKLRTKIIQKVKLKMEKQLEKARIADAKKVENLRQKMLQRQITKNRSTNEQTSQNGHISGETGISTQNA